MDNLPTFKRYFYSSVSTFLATSLMTLALQFQAGSIEWTWIALFSIFITALRAGIKAVVESIIEHRLATGKPV